MTNTLILVAAMIFLTEQPDLQVGLNAFRNGDYSTAWTHLGKLAQGGSVEAQYTVALMLCNGNGVEKDMPEGMRLMSAAAEKGYSRAESFLGMAYSLGSPFGIAQSDAESFKWYLRAAQHGDLSSQRHVGYLYEMGRGVPRDYQEAVKWFSMAAEKGYPPAISKLGVMFLRGRGVPRDAPRGLSLLRRASTLGHRGSCLLLAESYAEGNGVRQDYFWAYVWAHAGTGIEPESAAKHVRAFRDTIGLRLSADERRKAEEIAANWPNIKDQ